MKKDEICIHADIGLNAGEARVWRCDLTKEYVVINGNYPAADFPALAAVRQLEALGSRAWVAGETAYDRTWVCRKTPDYPSRRLNSVTPLDPADGDHVAERIARLCLPHQGRVLPLRATPLVPSAVIHYCKENAWQKSASVLVLTAVLKALPVQSACCPAEMAAEADYVAVSLANRAADPALSKPFLAILQRIRGRRFPFVLRKDGVPVASMLVVHDGGFAGLLDISVAADSAAGGVRRQGIGRAFIAAVLQELENMQVSRVWLQAGADNVAALRLCQFFGFARCYDYAYWSPR